MVILQPAAEVVKIEFDEPLSPLTAYDDDSLTHDDDGGSPGPLAHKLELNRLANDGDDDDARTWHGGASASPPDFLKDKMELDELADHGTRSEVGAIVSRVNDVVSAILSANPSPTLSEKVAGWRHRLKVIKKNEAQTPRFSVAVLGASGAGKSWLINALLGDHIVLTSGLQACTAMPIEVSYHPHELVNAQIEFISREGWLEEIGHLKSALVDAKGDFRALVEDGKEAWDRIHAVYPELTGDEIHKLSAEAVINSDPDIASKLGGTIAFSSSSTEFGDSFKSFIESHKKDVELWPVIARVMIQSNAPVLKNGLTLVDLPGSEDSNRARASIHKQYLKKCDHVFIVAQVKRAATDNVAHDLLGKAFKAQFKNQKYTADRVTFVATGNDDISCKEIVSQLHLSEDEEWKTLDAAARDIAAKIRAAKKAIDDINAEIYRAGPEMQDRTRHRVRGSVASTTRGAERSQEELRQLDLRLSDAQARYDRLFQSKSEQERQAKFFCARKRSGWSRTKIQEDFKKGLQYLCDEGEVEAVGDISVFTVSAHDYLKLIGMSPYDGSPSTFQSEEDTAIPDLIRYCQRLGLQKAHEARKHWASLLSKIVGDIELQVSDSVVQSEKDQASLKTLWNSTRRAGPDNDTIRMTMRDRISREVHRESQKAREKVLDDLNGVLIPHMNKAAKEAGKKVPDHIHALGSKIVCWGTIKALCRRNGVWKKHDWNSAALELFLCRVAVSWARILGVQRLEEGAAAIERVLRSTLVRMQDEAPDRLKAPVTQCIDRAMKVVQTHLQEAIQERCASIQERQQEISRTMPHKIRNQMKSLYASGAKEKDIGAKRRAMDMMRDGLRSCSDTLFTSIVEDTAHALRTSLTDSLDKHSAKVSEIPDMVESQMSLLWCSGSQAAGTAFTKQQAAPIRDMLSPISLLISAYRDKEIM